MNSPQISFGVQIRCTSWNARSQGQPSRSARYRAMKTETRMFFKHLLENNLPVDRFLDSDFTFVNGGLARLYGIPGVTGSQFRRVELSDRRRGGLLGMASILTASANGIDTSPVVRGVWILENILGSPPNPPPPDTEPLEPDIRGAQTIRDQLDKHRHVPTCNACHRKIDPPGKSLCGKLLSDFLLPVSNR